MDLLENEYRLLKVLGSGASGLVYLAEELTSSEFVAIKEFSATRESTSHFLRELSTLFTLRHPNLVGCRNLIYGGREKSYLVMEYADGGSLRHQLSKEGKQNPNQARLILSDLLNGLDVLHENDIVHCDVKPENILIFAAEKGRPVYKLTDLGIARFRSSAENKETPGSPMYMAPEQFYETATEASDIYSLGAIYFEMLTGKFLFEGEPDQLFSRHLNEEPDLDLITCPKSRKLCARMLCKSASERPRNAQAVLDLMNHIWDDSAGFPVLALHSTRAEKKFDTLTLEQEREVAGATSLAPGRGNTVLVSRGTGSDLLDLERQVIKPLYFPDAFSACERLANGSMLLAGGRWMYRLEGRNRLRPLFRPRTTVKSLAVSDKGDRIFYSDGKKLFCVSILGEQLWCKPLPNYFLEPQMLACHKTGRLLATSGPSNPHLHIFDQDGTELVKRSLPSPCFGLSPTAGGHRIYLLPQEREKSSSVLNLTLDSALGSVQSLEASVSKMRALPSFDILLAPGELSLLKNDAQSQLKLEAEGTPLDAVWSEKMSALVLLTQRGRKTYLQRWQASASVTTETERNRT